MRTPTPFSQIRRNQMTRSHDHAFVLQRQDHIVWVRCVHCDYRLALQVIHDKDTLQKLEDERNQK